MTGATPKTICALVVLALVVIGCGSDAERPAEASGQKPVHLDCGDSRSGTKRAMVQLARVLERGDREEILSVLSPRGRFVWISLNDARGPDFTVRDDRVRAARAVERAGGMPMRVTRWYNADPPRRSSSLGFSGVWDGERRFSGKAEIDCDVGKARVLSVGVGRN